MLIWAPRVSPAWNTLASASSERRPADFLGRDEWRPTPGPLGVAHPAGARGGWKAHKEVEQLLQWGSAPNPVRTSAPPTLDATDFGLGGAGFWLVFWLVCWPVIGMVGWFVVGYWLVLVLVGPVLAFGGGESVGWNGTLAEMT
jgi:hypothetical protein